MYDDRSMCTVASTHVLCHTILLSKEVREARQTRDDATRETNSCCEYENATATNIKSSRRSETANKTIKDLVRHTTYIHKKMNTVMTAATATQKARKITQRYRAQRFIGRK